MKKIAVLAIALSLAVCSASAQTSSILNSLKKVATETADQLTGGQLTKAAIIGTWQYSSPAVKLATSEEDKSVGAILKNAGGTAASSMIEQKLATYVEKIGIKKGMCSITFKDDGTFAMPVKGKNVTGTYTFDPSDHSLTLKIGTKISVTGHAYISGSDLQMVFSVEKFTTFLTSIASAVSNSTIQSIAKLMQQYKNAQLGLAFTK